MVNQRLFSLDFSLLCADGIPLLMEDHRPRPCQPRPWLREQKCPTGFWCHEGDDDSSYYCCPRNRKCWFDLVVNRCHLPPATGHGNKAMRRFYYDWTNDGCHELTYTGIGGNENSFISYELCEETCRENETANLLLTLMSIVICLTIAIVCLRKARKTILTNKNGSLAIESAPTYLI
ncbi:unnamed protein product [Strongylus vulgaris]|uniref:BPTI/Kunitz inhibitor domain-containing protein n=1 Tax=Strongylus vulgaris TaxID=40348 RepID=A0A3P7JTU0_STRVU|nr:unnamed protein product [Strongylus vulgaris]